MSFDIYYEIEIEGEEWDERWVNITGNLGAYFAWALHGADPERNKNRSDSRDDIFGKAPTDGMPGMHGLSRAEAEPLLRAAVERTKAAKAEFLDQFNASNGWGTWPRGLQVLEKMHGWCLEEERPAGKFRISW